MKILKTILATIIFLQLQLAHAAEDKDFNVRANVAGFLFGSNGLFLDYKINSNFTVGPEFGDLYISRNGDRGDYLYYGGTTTNFYGARANWFLNGTFTSGLYVGASLLHYHSKVIFYDSADGSEIDLIKNGTVIRTLVGYCWYRSNFNQMLGIGPNIPFENTNVTSTDSVGQHHTRSAIDGNVAVEYSVGWMF